MKVLGPHQQFDVRQGAVNVSFPRPPAFRGEIDHPLEASGDAGFAVPTDLNRSGERVVLRTAFDLVPVGAGAEGKLDSAVAHEMVTPEWQLWRAHGTFAGVVQVNAATHEVAGFVHDREPQPSGRRLNWLNGREQKGRGCGERLHLAGLRPKKRECWVEWHEREIRAQNGRLPIPRQSPSSDAEPEHQLRMIEGECVLEARDVAKSYDGSVILRGVSLQVARGERVALMGPSGSGKTTLLNCLAGVDRPDSGTIRLQGQPLEDLDGNGLARLRRKAIGTVFQFFHLLPTLSAFENVELPLQLLKVGRLERHRRVSDLMRRVRMAERAHAVPAQLSGGEQQRVALARAMVHQPALLLADEPTGNLDSVNGDNVLDLLRELSDESGTALVLVTHSHEATRICHRVLHLRDGRICEAS
jgi:ABC-type lipoprotein export system ATPase subunit